MPVILMVRTAIIIATSAIKGGYGLHSIANWSFGRNFPALFTSYVDIKSHAVNYFKSQQTGTGS